MAKPKQRRVEREGDKKAKEKASILSPLTIEDKPIVINQWDGATVKNTLDDCVHKYMLDCSEGFEEDFFETDMRLLVCFLGCAFAGFACIWGFLVPHPDSTPVVSICVVGYFVLVSLLTLYQTFLEEPTLLYARNGKSELKVFTMMDRYSTEFIVEAIWLDSATDAVQKEEVIWDISNYFYEDGELAHGNVQSDVEALCASLYGSKDTK